MKLGQRKGQSATEPDLAKWSWVYYARKVGIDPVGFEGSPLDAIAERRAVIANGDSP